MTARLVFEQSNGEVTRQYYADLNSRGPLGQIAVCLFRAQKTSTRAKRYRGRGYRGAAYDVKSWSMGEVCKLLAEHGEFLGFRYGWKEDPSVPFGEDPSWVLYVDIPQFGQVSFHSPSRGTGPAYAGDWDQQHASEERILAFCDHIMNSCVSGEIAHTGQPEARNSGGTEDPCTRAIATHAGPKPMSVGTPPYPSRLVFGDPESIMRARKRA